MATETLTCNFIGDFKVGDNVVSNAASLCKLVASNEGEIFNKLIVVQAGSSRRQHSIRSSIEQRI